MLCPVCETESPPGAAECARCGKQLAAPADVVGDVTPIEGLELTPVASKDLPIRAETVPGVELTKIEEDPTVTPLWSGGVDLDLGRERDDGERTSAPDTRVCPFCGTISEGPICDGCGQRKLPYLEPAAAAAAPAGLEMVRCPSCLARVLPGPRCSDCGLPFPLTEI